jgi:hypothetical protein
MQGLLIKITPIGSNSLIAATAPALAPLIVATAGGGTQQNGQFEKTRITRR